MVLVFFICLFLILLVTVIILSTISVRIEKFKASNYNEGGKLNIDYKVFFELLFLNKLKIFSIKIDKELIDKLKVKEKVKKIDFKQAKTNMPSKKDLKQIVKKLQIRIDKLNLKLEIGTIDIFLTSAIITILASIIGIGLARGIKKYDKERYNYEIHPIYQDKNIIKLNLNCIIKVKMVHIISIIYLLIKKRRVEENERTSNRRSYDYSYE
ncbi:MAG: hypothetical protein HFJ58_06915 [Clostridia bacterium]|nr:hypothetical protein [Clostridia bacterium]